MRWWWSSAIVLLVNRSILSCGSHQDPFLQYPHQETSSCLVIVLCLCCVLSCEYQDPTQTTLSLSRVLLVLWLSCIISFRPSFLLFLFKMSRLKAHQRPQDSIYHQSTLVLSYYSLVLLLSFLVLWFLGLSCLVIVLSCPVLPQQEQNTKTHRVLSMFLLFHVCLACLIALLFHPFFLLKPLLTTLTLALPTPGPERCACCHRACPDSNGRAMDNTENATGDAITGIARMGRCSWLEARRETKR